MVLQRIARVFGGDVNKRELERLYRIADEINAYEQPFEELSDGELKEKPLSSSSALPTERLWMTSFRKLLLPYVKPANAPSVYAIMMSRWWAELYSTRARSPKCVPVKARPWSPPFPFT